jgi:hypothetical protein
MPRILGKPRRSAAPGERAGRPRRGGRRAKMRRAKLGRRRRQTAARPALPFRWPAPMWGWRRRKRLVFRCFWARLYSCPRRERRRCAFQRGWSAVVEQLEISANHLGTMSLVRRFVTLCCEESAPLVVMKRCPISFHYWPIRRTRCLQSQCLRRRCYLLR